MGLAYFEISISNHKSEPLGLGDSDAESELSEEPVISIGFGGEFTDQTQAHVGWNIWSVGYHGDDGGVFQGLPYLRGDDSDRARPYGNGNTVGCGIDYRKGEVFFTLDGEVIGTLMSIRLVPSIAGSTIMQADGLCSLARHSNQVIFRKLYPTISQAGGACKVEVNFGDQDFVWSGEVVERLERPNLTRTRTGTFE
jgi:hypothetical protein